MTSRAIFRSDVVFFDYYIFDPSHRDDDSSSACQRSFYSVHVEHDNATAYGHTWIWATIKLSIAYVMPTLILSTLCRVVLENPRERNYLRSLKQHNFNGRRIASEQRQQTFHLYRCKVCKRPEFVFNPRFRLDYPGLKVPWFKRQPGLSGLPAISHVHRIKYNCAPSEGAGRLVLTMISFRGISDLQI
jgi:hypothetical protein